MEDNVQLKEEEVVGDEVVLTDIYPKTNTGSVVDQSSGRQLNDTLDFMWQKINNKLSRVVNSVNNRTGVVVLTSEDVGLGNVDNVSFADIKQWVIDLLVQEFGNKRIYLAEHLDEIDELVKEPFDLTHRDQAFFSKHGYKKDNDLKSYIGYIYYDEPTKSLKVAYKAIRVVGSTDQSLLYNDDNGNVKLHIWNGQKIVKVRDTGVTEDSGVYLDEDELYKGIKYYDGVYTGNWADNVNKRLIQVRGFVGLNTSVSSGQYVNIYMFDHENRAGELIAIVRAVPAETFHIGEMVYCGFAPILTNEGEVDNRMNAALLNREPCIGFVTREGSRDPSDAVRIIFYPVKPNVGWSMRHTITHRNAIDDNTNQGTYGQALDVSLASVKFNKSYASTDNEDRAVTLTSSWSTNVSGMQVVPGSYDISPYTNKKATNVSSTQYVNFPSGQTEVFSLDERQGGLFINPDSSLCVIPLDQFSPHSRARILYNWAPSLPGKEQSLLDWLALADDQSLNAEGVLYRPSYLGVNVRKALFSTTDDESKYIKTTSQNVSGLRVMGKNSLATNDDQLMYFHLGMNYGEFESRYPNSRMKIGDGLKTPGSNTSGGIVVNVGQFLEIDPGEYSTDSGKWYDGGKVNVRVGRGLEAEPDSYDVQGRRIGGNKIQLKLSEGLEFTADGALKVPGTISSAVELDVIDTYSTHFIYNPIPQSEQEDSGIIKSTIELRLGKGLKIVTDDMNIDEFRTLLNGLTGKQIEYYINDSATMNIQLIRSRINGLINTAEDNISILQSEIDKIKDIKKKYPSSMSTLPHYTKTLEEMITVAKSRGETDFTIATMTLVHLENICMLDSGISVKDIILDIFYQILPYHAKNSVTVERILNVCATNHMAQLIGGIMTHLTSTVWKGSYSGCDPSLQKYYNDPDAENAYDKVTAISKAITIRIDNAQMTNSNTTKVNSYIHEYTYAELNAKFYKAYGIGGTNGVPTNSDKENMLKLIGSGSDAIITTDQVKSALTSIKTNFDAYKTELTTLGDMVTTSTNILEIMDDSTGVAGLSIEQLDFVFKWALPEAKTLEAYVKLIIDKEGG